MSVDTSHDIVALWTVLERFIGPDHPRMAAINTIVAEIIAVYDATAAAARDEGRAEGRAQAATSFGEQLIGELLDGLLTRVRGGTVDPEEVVRLIDCISPDEPTRAAMRSLARTMQTSLFEADAKVH